MFRIFIIISLLVMVVHDYSMGQGVADFAQLSTSNGEFKEQTYFDFIKAAREDGDSAKVIIASSLLGRFYTHQQRYPEAEKQLLAALENVQKLKFNIRKAIGMASVSIYDTYDYLGEFYTETANYRNAEFFFKESEKIRSHEFSRGSIFRIFNIQNLAQFYLNTEQNDLAEQYLLKLNRELNRTKFNSEKLKYAYAVYYKGMTEVSIRKGRLKDAEKFLKKTFIFYASPYTSYGGAIRRLEGTNPETLLLRSRVLMMKGETEEALKILSTAINRQPDTLNFLPKLLRYQSICFYQKKNIPAALVSAKTLLHIDIFNLHKIFPALSENEKEEFNKRISYDFDLFNSFVIKASEEKMLEQSLLSDLIGFRLQTKALLLNNSRKIRQDIFASNDSSLIHDFQLLSQLKNQASVEVFRKKSERKMDDIEAQIERLEKTVSNRIKSLNTSVNNEATTGDIQRKLQKGEIALEIIQAKKFGWIKSKESISQPGFTDSTEYFVLLIAKDHFDYTVITNGNVLENRMVKFFKNSVQVVSTDSILYLAFWKPIQSKLKETTTVYFSGDGVYNQINLNLLYNSKGYLLDQYEIILLSNLKDMVSTHKAHDNKSGTFIGHPQYEIVQRNDVSPDEVVTRALRAVSMEELKGEDFSDLPGTENEVLQGASILSDNGWTIKKVTGRDADESHVKNTINPSLLHIATHGFFIEKSWGINPMLRSGLIFSGVKNAETVNGEDGILTAYEASALTLDSTNLVVLSACETGTGEVKNGEGVYGLQRAFMIAGAKNIIMSLWKVDDTATQKLMSYFYSNLVRTKNIRNAFTEAQKTLRKEYPEPLYWGAFVLIGM